MKVRKFEGATMRDAIAKVKAELGDQAVILSTREIRKGLIGTAFEIAAAIEDTDDASGPVFGGPVPPPSPRGTEPDLDKLIAPLRSELKSLRALVRAANDHKNTSDMRSELAALRKLVEDLRSPPAPSPRPGGGAALARGSSPALSPVVAPSASRRLLLVGPTGVGKTTTVAKLAARAALIEGRTVSLITLDSYRVGGAEQIRAFADLIGVPLRRIDDPSDLADALTDEADLTLIDTAGRSPRDTTAIAELAALVGDLPDLEVHLVAAAGTSAPLLDDLVMRYAPLRPARLLFTKLDEIDGAPEIVNAPARHALPVTWVTTGQRVPEDIEEPTATRLLELSTAGSTLTTPPPPSTPTKSPTPRTTPTLTQRAYRAA